MATTPSMSADPRPLLAAALADALRREGIEAPTSIDLARPKVAAHGDWSSNIAMVVAKAAGRNPRDLATALAAQVSVELPAHVTAVEVAGGGFVNFRLADTWLHDVLRAIVAGGVESYARLQVPEARRVVVEYVSANPTGPLHAGHARWAAFGDALSRVLARAGYSVHREFYLNDRGVQMQKFGESLVARRDGTPLPEGGYEGDYIIEWAAEMPAGVDPPTWGRDYALAYQRATMARMGVEFDTFSSELSIAQSGAVEASLEELRAAGHVYVASTSEADSESESEEVLDEIDDDAPVGGETDATWLRTSAYGDDKDRVLIKADGMYTYFMPDIAYHRDKYLRGDLLIDVFGADHHGYVRRMKAAMQCLGHHAKDLEILVGQNCVLMRNGVEVRMSKRRGDIIELAEIIDEVGPDSAKFTFLLQSIDTRQMVDLDLIVKQSSDNPVFYVQYAHARIAGVARTAAERGVVRAALVDTDLSQLTHTRELDLLRALNDLPDVVRFAAAERAPHKVTTWCRELAAAFQGFYHDCPILHPDTEPAVRDARLWLVEATRIGLVIGLVELLGVSAPDSM